MNKFSYNTPKVALRMPQIGDNVVRFRGEIKDKFIIVKEYEHYFLGISIRLGFKECFTKAGFFTGEYKVERQGEEL